MIFFEQRFADCITPLIILCAYYVWTYDFFTFRMYGLKASGLLHYKFQSIIIGICIVMMLTQIIIVILIINYNSPFNCSFDNPHRSPLYNYTFIINLSEMLLVISYIIAYLSYFFLTHKDFRFSFKSADGKQYVVFFIRFIFATIILVVSFFTRVLAFTINNQKDSIIKEIFIHQVPYLIQFFGQFLLTLNTSQWFSKSGYNNISTSD
ncbi:THH1/TOM1/TOM3 domain-containing protein [Entamoeba marina]